MSSQLASIIPSGPLTDEVFPFNQEAFTNIRNYQQKDLAFLQSPPIKALVATGDIVGGASTAVVGGVGSAATGVASSLFGGIGQITGGLPGGGLLHQSGQSILGGISLADSAAQQLVDPTKVARQHYHYSNEVNQALPPAIDAVDKVIYEFSSSIGNVQVLYENIATQGLQIIIRLESGLAQVDTALGNLYGVLTKDNIQESIIVGQDKYKGTNLSNQKNYLGELSQNLPIVLKVIIDVRAAFASILSNLKIAQAKINSGVTDPSQIFSNSLDDVKNGWQGFEAKRKTMTYLPYKY